MATMYPNLPEWNADAVLPPIWPGESEESLHRSPYKVALSTIVEQLAISPQRIRILQGLLSFRSTLYDAGISSGFQWLNGSFFENVEQFEGRDPNDIDVVTFIYPMDQAQQSKVLEQADTLFDYDSLRDKHLVDAYYMQLDGTLDREDLDYFVYWYSMWSHRRGGTWKGFAEVELDPAMDAAVKRQLDSMRSGSDD